MSYPRGGNVRGGTCPGGELSGGGKCPGGEMSVHHTSAQSSQESIVRTMESCTAMTAVSVE